MLRIVILTAVRLEAAAMVRALNLKPQAKDHWSFGEVSLFVVGIGAAYLAEVPVPLHGVIMAGVAGGLSPELKIGDVVVDELSTLGGVMPGVRGKIYTAGAIISTPAEKARCFAETGAIAVEMENSRVRDWASTHRIAYAGVRGISDTASHTLDPAMLTLIDERGGIKAGALATFLLRRPGMIGALTTLGKNSKAAAAAAADAVKVLIAAGWPLH